MALPQHHAGGARQQPEPVTVELGGAVHRSVYALPSDVGALKRGAALGSGGMQALKVEEPTGEPLLELGATLGHPVSRQWKGYWQRGAQPN